MTPPAYPPIDLAFDKLGQASTFSLFLEYPPLKAIIPAVVIAAIAPIVWLFFRKTWAELDAERQAHARNSVGTDYRPFVALILLGTTLAIHEYYGGRAFFAVAIEPVLRHLEEGGMTWLQVTKFHELWGYGYWILARIVGYMVAPIVVWKLFFRSDSILDMGLRVKGFLSHVWIYLLCLVVVFGAMLLVAKQRDFLSYYPFYKGASRSWFDLLMWEGMYFAQFFALEFYFRGWLLQSLRKTMGAAAIFAMAVPYCMIHFGKPYLEAQGAIIAGVVLGSLSMRTKSIYAGFLVHITVAGLMDYFALMSRGGMPTKFWP